MFQLGLYIQERTRQYTICVVMNSPLLSDISSVFCVSGSSSRAYRIIKNIMWFKFCGQAELTNYISNFLPFLICFCSSIGLSLSFSCKVNDVFSFCNFSLSDSNSTKIKNIFTILYLYILPSLLFNCFICKIIALFMIVLASNVCLSSDSIYKREQDNTQHVLLWIHLYFLWH